MGEFFGGWKRKTGFAGLIVAMAFLCCWLRSLLLADHFESNFGRSVQRIHSSRGTVDLQWTWCYGVDTTPANTVKDAVSGILRELDQHLSDAFSHLVVIVETDRVVMKGRFKAINNHTGATMFVTGPEFRFPMTLMSRTEPSPTSISFPQLTANTCSKFCGVSYTRKHLPVQIVSGQKIHAALFVSESWRVSYLAVITPLTLLAGLLILTKNDKSIQQKIVDEIPASSGQKTSKPERILCSCDTLGSDKRSRLLLGQGTFISLSTWLRRF